MYNEIYTMPDDELTKAAQSYADQCKWSHSGTTNGENLGHVQIL